MFNPKHSVSEFVIKTTKNENALKFKTSEEKEFALEIERIDKEVDDMVMEKMNEFSFEVKPNWRNDHFKELDDVQVIIDNTVDSYRILKKAGKFKEAKLMM